MPKSYKKKKKRTMHAEQDTFGFTIKLRKYNPSIHNLFTENRTKTGTNTTPVEKNNFNLDYHCKTY